MLLFFKRYFLVLSIITINIFGDVVSNISIEGNRRIEGDTILSYIPIKLGDDVNDDIVSESIKILYNTGYFEDVNIKKSGKTLFITLKENPLVNRVAFEGNDKLKDEIIEKEVKIRPREVLSRAKVQNVIQRIMEIYRRMGRFAATVEPKIIKLDENRVDLIFEINEGPTTFIRKILFNGNKAFSSSKLEGSLESKRTRWYNFFTSNDIFDPDRFKVDQENLIRFYGDRGYPMMRVISANAELSDDKKDFFITFTIDEGDLYNFGKVDFDSKIVEVNTDKLKKQVEFSKGDLFSQKQVDKTIDKLTELLGAQGFAFAQVEALFNGNIEEKTIDIVFDIRQGLRAYVERIEVVGNDRTRDYVIRRELAIREGDAYNTSKIKKSERYIRNLGHFKTVNITTKQGSSEDKVILVINVEEQPTGELTFSAGYSTLDGMLAKVGFAERNFRGRGQTVHAEVSAAKKRQEFNLGFIEPYLFGKPLEGSVDVFSTRSTRVSSYTELSKGIQFGLGYRLTEYLYQILNYNLHQDEIKNVSQNSSQLVLDQKGKTVTSSIGQTLIYDRRDSRFETTSGYVLSMSNTFAGVGGDVSYLKNIFSGTVFYSPIESVVTSLKGTFGFMNKTGKKIRISDSFLLGGDSFHGFEYGGIGPRDKKTGDTLGGTRYWVVTPEVLFPLGLPNEFGVKGAVYSDIGSVWRAPQKNINTIDKSSMRASVGAAILWNSPFGPLRIDYAVSLKREKYDKRQQFLFGFSSRF